QEGNGVRGAGVPVDVNPRSPVLRVGQNFTFKCSVGNQLQYCRIQLPGNKAYNLNEKVQRTSEYWYEGAGLNSGQCGITIARIKEEHNGQFQCTMGTLTGSEEIVGQPQGPPELKVSPESDTAGGKYKEDTTIVASCTVRNSRPKATLSWYLGDDQITDGVSREDVTESLQGNLYTVTQNFTRRLSWRDSSKALRCEARHITYEYDRPMSTSKQISVVFGPKPRDKFDKFGLVVGQDETIIIQIQANPQPRVTWNIGGEDVNEGFQDSTQRFTVSRTRNFGNDTWESSLTISAISPDDVERKYIVKAQNELGEQQYRVVISTEAAPQGSVLELGTGPIIGIVVAILVILIVIFMLIFARATGRWCFSAYSLKIFFKIIIATPAVKVFVNTW
ncbi:hypothetical protein L9F63_007618, partial [Diploptera punctata]